MSTCPKCNKQFPDEIKFCDACGSELVDAPKVPAANPFADVLSKVTSVVSKKMIGIAVAAVALVVVIAIILSSVFSGGIPNTFAYVKDGELNFSTVSKAKGEVVYDEDGYFYSSTVQISEDGKRLFYLDEDRDLYYANTASLDKEAKKVASSVSSYIAIGDGKTVIYTNDKSKLYSVKVGKEPVSIDKDVDDFMPSENGKKVLYSKYNDDGYGSDWYITKNSAKAEKGEKVATGANFEYVSKDFTKFVYTKNDSLYSLTLGKEEYRIAKDVGDFVKVYDSGEIYFTCVEESDNEDDDYYYSTTEQTLWYYAGNKKDAVKVSDEYNGYSGCAFKAPVIIFYSRNEDYEYTYTLAVKDATYEIGTEDFYTSYDLSEDGKEVLYLKDRGDDEEEYSDTGTLCKATVSKGLKNEKVIDEDVNWFGYNSDKIYYIKDFDEDTEEGALYFDGKLVSEDVYDGYFSYIEKSKTLIFRTNYDDNTEMYTLNFFKGGKVVASQDDVAEYQITNEGEVLMIVDPEDYEGDLYLFNGSKKIKQVDTDVSSVFVPLCFSARYSELEGDAILY